MAVEISVARAQVIEGSGYVYFTVTLSAPAPASGVSMSYRTRSGTALDGSDFVGVSGGTLTFAPGETSGSIRIDTYSDSVDETDESFTLELYNPTGAVFAGDVPLLRTIGTILDNDGTGSNLALSVSNPVLVEGGAGTKTVHVEATLSEAPTSTIVVPWQTVDGTARAGQDYVAASGSVTFLPGQTTAAVDVAVTGDAVSEPTEGFSVVFSPPAAVVSGANGAVGQVTILDDDAASGALPSISVFSGQTIENGGYVYFTVTLSAPAPASGVSMSYRTRSGTALDGSDFVGVSGGTLTFAPGETSGSIRIDTYSDSVDETDESFTLELYNPTGAVFAGDVPLLRTIGTILDNDGTGSNLALSVSNPVLVEGGAGTKTVHVEATLSEAPTSTIVVPWQTVDGTARAGQDYVAASGSVTFLPGQTTAAVDVAVTGDAVSEPTEGFSVVFSPPAAVVSGANGAVGQVTILDDDAASGALPSISVFSGQTIENGGYVYFTVTLSAPAPASGVSMSYRTRSGTALSGSDFVGVSGGTLTFAPGETSGSIRIDTYSDNVDETDESFTLELYNPTGAVFAGDAPVLRAAGTILDDDGIGSNLALTVLNSTISEGNSGTRTMQFEALLSRPASATVVVPWQTVDGTAGAGQDYVAASGSLTFLPGQTTASVGVTINSDRSVEPSETFSLVFSSPVSGPPVAATSATGTINNDDSAASAVRSDTNGDGTSDIVLQSSGAVVDWSIANGVYQSGGIISNGSAGYLVKGTGDLNGDGTSDIVLQNGGTVVDWIMAGGQYQTGHVLTTGAGGFTVVGTGDFNGDGTSDILLQNGGTVVDWLMVGGQYQQGKVITTGAAGYAVKGTGDFNGDGTSDIVLQNGGTVVVWLMQNGAYQTGNIITTAAAGFDVKGTGDFNADGIADIVLQGGGTVVDWIMQGGAYQSGNVITTGAAGFDVRNTGDYNKDGTDDIVLQGGGTVVDWIMQNGLYSTGNVITTGAAGYTVV